MLLFPALVRGATILEAAARRVCFEGNSSGDVGRGAVRCYTGATGGFACCGILKAEYVFRIRASRSARADAGPAAIRARSLLRFFKRC